jgi:hypothetical protein
VSGCQWQVNEQRELEADHGPNDKSKTLVALHAPLHWPASAQHRADSYCIKERCVPSLTALKAAVGEESDNRDRAIPVCSPTLAALRVKVHGNSKSEASSSGSRMQAQLDRCASNIAADVMNNSMIGGPSGQLQIG